MDIEVLILTGTSGVGKTTTANLWATSKKGVVIECDVIRELLDKDDFPQWSEKEEEFIAKISAMMTMEYLRNGFSVAIDNVWSPSAIETIRTELFRVNRLKITPVWLKCEKEANHNRDQQRMPEHQMKERIDIVAEELNGYEWPSYMNILDTSKMLPHDVVDEIVKL